MTAFDRAFVFLMGEEGGYVNDPRDPGGVTKYGISKKAYPAVDVANLTLDGAKAIYLRDYWTPLSLDERPYSEALCIFDCAVNQGLARAREILALIPTSQPFVAAFQAERGIKYAALPTWPIYSRGWMRRLFRVAIEASRSTP